MELQRLTNDRDAEDVFALSSHWTSPMESLKKETTYFI